eukprot:COSAG02_NODE_42_length_46522_cov_109.704478_7_plen_68_part_00
MYIAIHLKILYFIRTVRKRTVLPQVPRLDATAMAEPTMAHACTAGDVFVMGSLPMGSRRPALQAAAG